MKPTAPRYLLQDRSNSCCNLYALCNALRFYGRRSPEPGTPEWERLVDLAGCRHGSAVRTDEAAKSLGLVRKPISPDRAIERAPVMLTVWSPEMGMAMHSVLVIGGRYGLARLVNYRFGRGPVVEDVVWDTLAMPERGNVNRHAWTLRLAKGAPRS